MGVLVERELTTGRIEGISHAGVQSFLGIPYGESTAGAGRFAAPRPVRGWAGVRPAMAFGDAAPQYDTRLLATGPWVQVQQLMYPKGGHPLDGSRMSEDCLVLNVWAPTTEGTHPVMVWLHGGGFVHGSGGSYLYHGDQLAAVGDVVVVTLNHRLGLLGHLPLDQADAERYPDAGNAGMLDVVLALQWVRDNIAVFGGDPENVTVFGQSGGGVKATMLTGMPAAAGLFHKIINMSGAGFGLPDPEQAGNLLQSVLRLAEISSPEELRRWELRDLVALQNAVANLGGVSFDGSTADERPPIAPLGFAPVADGRTVASQPLAGPSDPGRPVPLLIGYATHDTSLLLCNADTYRSLTANEVTTRIAQGFGTVGLAWLDQYRVEYPDEPPRLHLARVTTDASFRRGALDWAERQLRRGEPVYAYEFAYQTPILEGLLGCPHSLDLPFAFNNVDRTCFAGDRPDRLAVADAMARAWTSFAWTGSPSHPGLPEWSAYGSGRLTMRLGIRAETFAGPEPSRLAHPAGLGERSEARPGVVAP